MIRSLRAGLAALALVVAGCAGDDSEVAPTLPTVAGSGGGEPGSATLPSAYVGGSVTTTTPPSPPPVQTPPGPGPGQTTTVPSSSGGNPVTPSPPPTPPRTEPGPPRSPELAGTLEVETHKVSIDGRRGASGDKIRSGSRVSTDANGAGRVTLKATSAECVIRNRSAAIVFPASIQVVGDTDRSEVVCEGSGVRMKVLSATINVISGKVTVVKTGTTARVTLNSGQATLFTIAGQPKKLSPNQPETVM